MIEPLWSRVVKDAFYLLMFSVGVVIGLLVVWSGG
jgi:hypothetical protein